MVRAITRQRACATTPDIRRVPTFITSSNLSPGVTIVRHTGFVVGAVALLNSIPLRSQEPEHPSCPRYSSLSSYGVFPFSVLYTRTGWSRYICMYKFHISIHVLRTRSCFEGSPARPRG
jgi:hypothetical protein